MTATDELRRMLTERGVRHEDEFLKSNIPFYDGLEMTEWNGGLFSYVEMINHPPDTPPDAPDLTIHNCTPQQAIAATLGDDGVARSNNGVTAEQVREAIEANSWAETSTIREFNDSSWQGIADELNATLGAGTCRNTNLPGYNYFKCSECGAKVYLGEDTFSYCPKCGRKVEG